MRCRKKIGQKKITEANFSNLVSNLLYTYLMKSTEKLWAKSICGQNSIWGSYRDLLLIPMFRFFIDLCVHQNACHEYYYFASLGIFMLQGCRTQRLTKSLHIFFCTDKRLFKDLGFERDHWKYWMSFIAWDCRFSRSYTVYSWFSKGCSYWAYQTMQWFPWVTTKQ